jgi:gamma-glutamyl:cysteine ligase YbdK (ATP-grasp superfamily)
MKIGVESEYWVVDETGALRDGRELISAHECVEPEFVAAMVEVKTPPVESEFELRHTLQSTLRTVLAAADAAGLRLVPLGTPLADSSSPIVSERGRLLERIYGDGLKPATQCAGTHVHFDAGNVARQVNLLTALDPALALVSSSPYYAGEGRMSASRPHAYRSLCGEEFVRFRDLWEYTTDVEMWNERLDAAYEAFRALALDRGVTDREFRACFRPEDVITSPIRVRRDFPTVEWRAPDTALPSQIVKLTTDVSRLVTQTAVKPVEIGEPSVGPRRIRVPAFEDLTELTRAAIEDGLDSPAVWAYLERMSIDPREYRPIAAEIERRSSISVPEARRIRLEYADRLEDDVRTLLSSTEMHHSRGVSMEGTRATTDRLESW